MPESDYTPSPSPAPLRIVDSFDRLHRFGRLNGLDVLIACSNSGVPQRATVSTVLDRTLPFEPVASPPAIVGDGCPSRFRTCSIARSPARTIVTCSTTGRGSAPVLRAAPDPARRSRSSAAPKASSKTGSEVSWASMEQRTERPQFCPPQRAFPKRRCEVVTKCGARGRAAEPDNRGGNVVSCQKPTR